MREKLIESISTLDFWGNHKLIWLPITKSTNEDLKSIWRNNDFQHCIEVADIQTNGKGQYDRKWSSDDIGQCLMFSFSLDIKKIEFPISMIAGIALAKAIVKLGINHNNLWLKWPNDIWINNQKLAGILTESTTFTEGFRSIVGIGINILPLSDKSVNSTSLFDNGIKVTREDVLLEFCNSWNDIYSHSSENLTQLWCKYANQFFNRQFKVQIPSRPEFVGTPLKIETDGTLIACNNNREEIEIISATLSPIL